MHITLFNENFRNIPFNSQKKKQKTVVLSGLPVALICSSINLLGLYVGVLFCLPAPLNLPRRVKPDCVNDVDDADHSEVKQIRPDDFSIGCRDLFSRAYFPSLVHLLVGHCGFMHLENKLRDDKRH